MGLQNTQNINIEETPFSLSFKMYAVISAKIGILS